MDAQERNPDTELLNRLRTGDVVAFRTIVFTYGAKLEEYASRIVSDSDRTEDIVQDVFCHIWEIRETLEIRGSLQSYLYGSVRNQALMMLRRDRMEEHRIATLLPDALPPELGTPDPGPAVIIERQELEAHLTRALASLAPRMQQVALLRWRDKMSRAEIADVLGVAVPTVNNQLTAAAKILRQLLSDYQADAKG